MTCKTIIINHYSDFYEIPEPKELLKNIGVCYVLHLFADYCFVFYDYAFVSQFICLKRN